MYKPLTTITLVSLLALFFTPSPTSASASASVSSSASSSSSSSSSSLCHLDPSPLDLLARSSESDTLFPSAQSSFSDIAPQNSARAQKPMRSRESFHAGDLATARHPLPSPPSATPHTPTPPYMVPAGIMTQLGRPDIVFGIFPDEARERFSPSLTASVGDSFSEVEVMVIRGEERRERKCKERDGGLGVRDVIVGDGLDGLEMPFERIDAGGRLNIVGKI
ncbi:hypothetical protein SISSUDRAFT_1042294 [Sistotremastrum suecicum HHB10207 ss-3]|uniref:Uncharacterized protein n=1 Tax=Sistotremastrum suecicum HHB10207 ss-3 TaxID=1314776 RepID=A0A166GL85_9AGAM|nr:hypothetical protein SISSUDRAFT_1042294 [Sistotremastrum suecicum HHB10207 ss-3]